jgi:hypothetical protein
MVYFDRSSVSGRSVPDCLILERGAILSSAIARELDQNGSDYFRDSFLSLLKLPLALLCYELII